MVKVSWLTTILVITMIINGFLYNKYVCIIPKEKLNDKFRIIFVGDSITDGVGTSKKTKSYPLLIKAALKQKYPNVDVIKNGAGWRTAQKHGDRPCIKDLECAEMSIL
jgi:lysophospholipase L1-like esterase